MAVRFTATTSYTATLTGGAQANYTMAGWFNIRVNRAAASTLISVESSASDYSIVQTTTAGNVIQLSDSFGIQANTITLTVGTWYFVALSLAAGTGTMYAWTEGATTPTTAAMTSADTSVTLTTARIADSQFGEPYNGSAAGVRIWSAALTQPELLVESKQLKPFRRTNLLGAWLLSDASDLADVSGGGHSFTGTSTTDTAGPAVPVQWNRFVDGTPDRAGYRASTW